MSRKNKQAKGLTGTLCQKLGQLLALSSNPQSEPGKPYLLENDGMLSLQFDALCLQSEMNIEDPDQLVFSYTRAMMSFLLFEPSPKRIAMIGLGGGSLAKYCYRYLPQAEIAVVEINPDVIALRNEFAIPADDARFKVLLGDGAVFVKESRRSVRCADGGRLRYVRIARRIMQPAVLRSTVLHRWQITASWWPICGATTAFTARWLHA